ncbi:hypothetical protein FKM82_003735 [Ascaphus truei]
MVTVMPHGHASCSRLNLLTEFSKKTGDYVSLSATDIKVLALTYQLEAEHVGEEHLRAEPQQKVSVSSSAQHPEAPVNVVGFHFSSKPACKEEGLVRPPAAQEQIRQSASAENARFDSFLFWRSPLPSIEEDLLELMNARAVSVTSDTEQLASPPHQGEDRRNASGESPDASSEEDDGEGWITPSNLKQMQQDMGVREAPVNLLVGCLTTDFAMQNVLIQMGLHVLSVDGMLIRQTRSWILRCHGCFRTTSDMCKSFCPHCGNRTLKKVAVSVSGDGSLHMHFSRNPKVLNSRGLRVRLRAWGGWDFLFFEAAWGREGHPTGRLKSKHSSTSLQ